jgi:ankyrin repeat protein
MDVVELLVDSGADLYVLNNRGETPADTAARLQRGKSRNLSRMKMEEDRGAESWLEGPQDG